MIQANVCKPNSEFSNWAVTSVPSFVRVWRLFVVIHSGLPSVAAVQVARAHQLQAVTVRLGGGCSEPAAGSKYPHRLNITILRLPEAHQEQVFAFAPFWPASFQGLRNLMFTTFLTDRLKWLSQDNPEVGCCGMGLQICPLATVLNSHLGCKVSSG